MKKYLYTFLILSSFNLAYASLNDAEKEELIQLRKYRQEVSPLRKALIKENEELREYLNKVEFLGKEATFFRNKMLKNEDIKEPVPLNISKKEDVHISDVIPEEVKENIPEKVKIKEYNPNDAEEEIKKLYEVYIRKYIDFLGEENLGENYGCYQPRKFDKEEVVTTIRNKLINSGFHQIKNEWITSDDIDKPRSFFCTDDVRPEGNITRISYGTEYFFKKDISLSYIYTEQKTKLELIIQKSCDFKEIKNTKKELKDFEEKIKEIGKGFRDKFGDILYHSYLQGRAYYKNL